MGEPVSRSQERLHAQVWKCVPCCSCSFLVILWSIYTNIKILFIDNFVTCAFKVRNDSECMEQSFSAVGPGVQQFGEGGVLIDG